MHNKEQGKSPEKWATIGHGKGLRRLGTLWRELVKVLNSPKYCPSQATEINPAL